MDDASIHAALDQLPLLQGMPDDVRAEIARVLVAVSEVMDVDVGKGLIQEGALGGTTGYVLLTGAVEVERAGAAPVRVAAPVLLGEMQQFNPQAFRTATVTATEPGKALRFRWPQFYAHARLTLREEAQTLLLAQLERLVWDRFHTGAVLDVPLFRALPNSWRLRAALLLVWIAHLRDYPGGSLLIEKGRPCGAMGHLLIKGTVALISGDQTRQVLTAPDLIGLHPDFDPDRVWTATARAQDDAASYVFSWQEYLAILERRLKPEEYAAFLTAARQAKQEHFAY